MFPQEKQSAPTRDRSGLYRLRLARHIRHNLILSLVGILLSLALAEVFLRVIDPLGAHRYFSDLEAINSARVQSTEEAYTFRPGIIQTSSSSSTINHEGTRVVPSTAIDADCRIAAIGDSVTFGLGVNDDETWLNLIASQYPDVQFVNAGRPGYNAGNFPAAINAHQADGYIYLAISNDADAPMILTEDSKGYSSSLLAASEEYVWVAFLRTGFIDIPQQDQERAYREQAAGFLKTPNMLVFTVDTNLFNAVLLAMRPDSTVTRQWLHSNSVADGHPNAEGHQEIAEQMDPAIRAWLPRVCP